MKTAKKITYEELLELFGFSIIKDMQCYFRFNKNKTVYKVNKRIKIRKTINNTYEIYN